MKRLYHIDQGTETAVRRFLALIDGHYETVGAIVFGSRARGTHRPDSDADVAVLLSGEPQRFLTTKLAMADVAFDVLVTDRALEPVADQLMEPLADRPLEPLADRPLEPFKSLLKVFRFFTNPPYCLFLSNRGSHGKQENRDDGVATSALPNAPKRE